VNKGVVLLAGETKSLDAHLKAVEIARSVAGVRRVASEVTVSGS
jgi:osmotically-inducible protein OsmY